MSCATAIANSAAYFRPSTTFTRLASIGVWPGAITVTYCPYEASLQPLLHYWRRPHFASFTLIVSLVHFFLAKRLSFPAHLGCFGRFLNSATGVCRLRLDPGWQPSIGHR